jgi:hypothetical protein
MKNLNPWHPNDIVLSPVTFEEIITTVHCNVKKPYTKEKILKEYRQIIKSELEDALFEIEHAMPNILNYLKRGD